MNKSKSRRKVDFSFNPEEVQVGDWVVKEDSEFIGEITGEVETHGNMLQFWVKWFKKNGATTPELASNLRKIPKEQNGYVGRETTEGIVNLMILKGKKVKYEVITDLGTPRLMTRSQLEKKLVEELPGQTNLLEQVKNEEVKQKIEEGTVNVYSIILDYQLQQRVKMDESTIEDYAEAYREGVDLPAITIFICSDRDDEPYLVDGFHRVEGAKLAQIKTLPCKRLQGTFREAQMYSFGVNAFHGLKRSNADKRKAVLTLLDDPEWNQLSNRELGKIANVSHQYIFKLRKEIKAKNKEIEEKNISPEAAAKYLKDENDRDQQHLKVKNNKLPPDIRSKNKKLKTYTIEIKEETLDKVCKRLQSDVEIITAEGLINDLLDRIDELENGGYQV